GGVSLRWVEDKHLYAADQQVQGRGQLGKSGELALPDLAAMHQRANRLAPDGAAPVRRVVEPAPCNGDQIRCQPFLGLRGAAPWRSVQTAPLRLCGCGFHGRWLSGGLVSVLGYELRHRLRQLDPDLPESEQLHRLDG